MEIGIVPRTGLRPRFPWVAAVALAVAVVVVVVIVALMQVRDPYPLPGGAGSSQTGPATLGVPTRTVVVFMEPHPGDRIELLGAEAIGLPPDVRPTFYLSRPVIEPDGSLLIGEALEPLAGAVIEVPSGASPGPDNAVGIVAEITSTKAGTYQLTAIRLRFRTNGGVEQVREGTSVVWTVCADDPAPASCELPEPES